MRYLLDTHIWLWMLSRPQRLNHRARELIENPSTELFLSSASAWEIAIKCSIGRLRLPEHPEQYVPARMQVTRVKWLAIEGTHALRVARLPPHHRDPFDRLLVAQSQIEQLPIITVDPVLGLYDVALVRAG